MFHAFASLTADLKKRIRIHSFFRRMRGRNLFMAWVALLILMAFAYVEFLHFPLRAETDEIEGQAARLSDEIVDIGNFMNRHSDLKGEMADLAKQRIAMDKALPEEMEQGAFMEEVQRSAVNSGVRLMSMTPGKAKGEQGISSLPIEIKLSSDYFSLMDFLKAVREGDRYMQIRRMSLLGKDDEIQCDMTLSIFSAGAGEKEEPFHTWER